ncbi:MAG: K+/H+ antiporter subunit F [Cobetia sp.]|jgi:multicomponent K+:H+ antiporter subunit F|uniref:K+/H+ antiporter subunit F n=1 Tax=Cobetia amphilecti TaxID=1055104 RepID=A0AAP4WZS8_9GAMM|nr:MULTISPECIES: K+/H+ antiporter subunit F [Cobetia]AVV33869.1 K+/H+ antiporter subunit F [Halomonas sp. SF2003]MBR9754906.1 K+/H+ antiporter subunit F [Gammaproteobacteria bacterium]NVN54535.1 K+/H+ antiporter subunit F [bacterium Scap17]TCJ24778.1 K+/H+ antiporter subunit F [Halomonas sp. GDM18]KGA01638.1 cation:proton antiporter [Cobetia amphilecti]|tara:strand:+ start:484 stop:753 length:270 start_codon:yes stop_codon:yes gene_type:complete
MLDIALWISIALFAASLVLNVFRLAIGPDLPDRILAVDTMYVNSIALIVLFGIQLNSKSYFEAALLIAMLGFVSTVAVCKYLLRGDIIE